MRIIMSVLFNICTILMCIGPWKVVSGESIEIGIEKLVFVNVLYRHGDRTPIDPYPNDPYKNSSFWPVGFGQLTNTGKRQQYELGKWLRKRYNSLLNDEYTRDEVCVQSTDKDRTLMSAASNLAGLYPPRGAQVWNPQIEWQPIPIHTIPENLDKVLASKVPCPAYDKELNRVLHSKEIQDLNSKFSNVYKILNENTGRNITKLEDIEYIYNTLYVENLYNFTLPAWSRYIYPQPMEEASKYSFAIPTWTLKLARLKAGLLVQDMISHMKEKKENKAKPIRNVWIYSAHDSTIANLLNTLGVFDLHSPPYTATVLMELWVDTSGNHQVKLFYRNLTSQEPFLLTLPGCTPVCPLDQFINHCQAFIPQDWERECHSSSLFDIAPDFTYNTFTIAALVVSVLLIVLLVISVALYWQKRKRPTHWYRKLKTDSL